MSYNIVARRPGTISTHRAANEAQALGVASVLHAAHIPFKILNEDGTQVQEVDLLKIIDAQATLDPVMEE